MTHITIEKEKLEQVLGALESCDQIYDSEGSYQYFSQVMVDNAITVIKQALAAQPAVPDAIHHTDLSEPLEYIQGWNDCRQTMLKGMK